MKSALKTVAASGGGMGLFAGVLVAAAFLAKNFTLLLSPWQTFLFFVLLLAVYGLVGILISVACGILLAVAGRIRRAPFCGGEVRAWTCALVGIIFYLLYTGRWWQLRVLRYHGWSLSTIACAAAIAAGAVILCAALRWFFLRIIPGEKRGGRRLILVAAILLIFLSLLPFIYAKVSAAGATGRLDFNEIVQPREGRVLFIGVDGASWKIMGPLLEEGALPHFSRLIREGTSADLETFRPCWSPIIWSTIFTGKLPDEHGVMDFVATTVRGLPAIILEQVDYPAYCGWERIGTLLQKLDLLRESPAGSSQRRVKALWNILSDGGKSVGIVRGWATWPVEEVNGFMVSDRLYQKLIRAGPDLSEGSLPEDDVYPGDMLPEILKFNRQLDETSPEEIARFMKLSPADEERYYRITERDGYDPLSIFKYEYPADLFYSDVGGYLLQKFRPDFFFFYLWGTDHTQHVFWKWMEPEHFSGVDEGDVEKYGRVIRNYFIFADEVLGRFMALMAPEDTIVVSSDHGFERVVPEGSEGPHQAGHRTAPEGILVISGPGIKRDYRLSEASVVDIAPTILYLMGFPVAEDMPGKILRGAFREEYLRAHPPRAIPTYEVGAPRKVEAAASDMDEELKQRLHALGYLQ